MVKISRKAPIIIAKTNNVQTTPMDVIDADSLILNQVRSANLLGMKRTMC